MSLLDHMYKMFSMEKLSHSSNLRHQLITLESQLPSLLVRISRKLSRMKLKMFLLSTMPHGVDIARNSHQFGMNLVSITKINQILSSPSLMPPPMRPMVLRLEDIQLSFSIQRITKLELTTAEKESCKTSKTGSPRTPQF